MVLMLVFMLLLLKMLMLFHMLMLILMPDVRGKVLMLMSKRSGREIEVWMLLVGRMVEPPTAE